MRLRFGLNADNDLHAVYCATVILALVYIQYEAMHRLDRSQESVFMLRMPNVTLVEARLYCSIPYDDCRCSIVPTKYCFTDTQLKISRLCTLALFLLQIYLIRELLSLSTDYPISLVYVSWTTSLLVFISILFTVYRCSCFYEYIAAILCTTGYLLFCFVAVEVARDKYRIRSPYGKNIMVNDSRSENDGNSVQS